MPNRFNGFWENGVLDKFPENIDVLKKELAPLLNAKIKGESVISSSVDALEHTPVVSTNYVAPGFGGNDFGYDNEGMGQDNSQTKAKQRVLTRSVGPGMVTSVSSPEPPRYTPVSYGSYEDINNDNGFSMSGSAQTLILICTAILVVMVVFVSLIVMKYMGL